MRNVDQDGLIEAIRALPEDPHYAHAAVFDADHTLWAADLGDDAFRRSVSRGLLRREAAAALACILEKNGLVPTGEPNTDAAAIHAKYMVGGISERDILETELVCYAGWNVGEMRALARAILAEGLEDAFHEETEPLVRWLESEGYQIHVVSGSPHWLVQEVVDALGIHADHVMGARVSLESDRLTDRIEEPVTFWQGKVDAFRAWLGPRSPRLAFGDSDGDLAMLLSAQLPVAVNPRPGLQAALEAQRRGAWYHFMPRRTRGGREVIAHRTDRIIV